MMSFKGLGMRVLLVMGQMRTAVLLLGLCAASSMSGTLLVQGLAIQDYVAKFGPFWAQVLWHAGLTDVFRAWWFIGILVFLLGSVSICIFRNGPMIWRQVRVKGSRGHRIMGATLVVDEGRLRGAGFRRVGEVDGYTVWQRGVMNRIGYFAVHVGVLGIAVAGVLSGFVGWRGTMNLREGEADHVVLVWKGREAVAHFLPFQVKNEAFEIEQYPTGMPKRYATNLRFEALETRNKKPDGGSARTVEVNRPVREGAYAFYQASFGDGGTEIKGRGLSLADGRPVPFEGHVYEKARLEDGTRVELLDFRPFTVETGLKGMGGERPTDVGPSLDYLVQPPDAEAVQLRAYLNHPEIVGVADGQKVGGASDGVVIYRPVKIGMSGCRDVGMSGLCEAWWRMVGAVAGGADLKAVAGGELAKIADEDKRVEAGLALVQAAKAVKELRLSHLIMLEDFRLKRYSGLQVAYDPGATLFWLMALVLVLGVMMMLGRRFVRVFVKDGSGVVVSPQGMRVVNDVREELLSKHL